MADLLSYMHDNPIALCEGLKAVFQDSLTVQNANDWRDRPDRLRKRVAWYRRKESAPRAGEYLWRVGTERWTEREIKSGTPSGRYLEARRARVLAVLGMTYEQARSRLTFEGKGASA